jgi:hypothetical protein
MTRNGSDQESSPAPQVTGARRPYQLRYFALWTFDLLEIIEDTFLRMINHDINWPTSEKPNALNELVVVWIVYILHAPVHKNAMEILKIESPDQ